MKTLLLAAALSINIAFGNTMNITLNGQTFTAALADTPAADALQQQLPLTLNLRDYNRNEKVSPLPQALPANDEAVGHIEAGDILLWQGDSLVIFYESFATPYCYTRLWQNRQYRQLKIRRRYGECIGQT